VNKRKSERVTMANAIDDSETESMTQAERDPQLSQEDEAVADALSKHPDCSYAEWAYGLTGWFQRTICVNLWRNAECHGAGDPPKYVEEGYPYVAD
jgi:hypothetical protein